MWLWRAIFSYLTHTSKAINEKRTKSNHQAGLQLYGYPSVSQPGSLCAVLDLPEGSEVVTDTLVMPLCLLNPSRVSFCTLNEDVSQRSEEREEKYRGPQDVRLHVTKQSRETKAGRADFRTILLRQAAAAAQARTSQTFSYSCSLDCVSSFCINEHLAISCNKFNLI